MALILNIDTAGETATISISEKEDIITFITNHTQKDHAAFLHTAIKQLLQNANVTINQLNAIAVTAGPGSYTGLRVGMASAKGLCYGLGIPMITISTLEVMTASTINHIRDPLALYCPMMDARRMEVFTAMYDYGLTEVIKPFALILNDLPFKLLLEKNKIYFSGSGSLKLGELVTNKNGVILQIDNNPGSMASLAFKNYKNRQFADTVYVAPIYLKEFYTIKNHQ